MPTDLSKSAFISPGFGPGDVSYERSILHIDMDAFFAQVEQVTNPRLRGRPIAVVGSKKRTVVVTSSYEARKFGVKTGMTMGEVVKKCPDIIFVPGNNRKYIDTSVRIIEILRDFSPYVEVYSIDEAFVDLTGSLKLFGGAKAIAQKIKGRIKDEMGLTSSVGIAPNKLIAKLASDLEKPDGLVLIRGEDVPGLLKDLPIEEICGIGRRTGKKLNSLGIETMGELAAYPVGVLKKKFGIIGERLHYMALGIDESPVVPLGEEDEASSIGHSMTFPYDITEIGDLHKYLLLLSVKVGRRARREACAGRTISLTVRFSDFTGTGKRTTLKSPIHLDTDIYDQAVKILATIDLPKPVRLLGISLSNLTYRGLQIPIFPDERKEFLLTMAMDDIKDRFGDDSLTYASVSDRLKEAGVISPAWRPSGPRRVDPL